MFEPLKAFDTNKYYEHKSNIVGMGNIRWFTLWIFDAKKRSNKYSPDT